MNGDNKTNLFKIWSGSVTPLLILKVSEVFVYICFYLPNFICFLELVYYYSITHFRKNFLCYVHISNTNVSVYNIPARVSLSPTTKCKELVSYAIAFINFLLPLRHRYILFGNKLTRLYRPVK